MAPRPRKVAIPRLLHVDTGCLDRVAPLLAEHEFELGRVLVGSGPGPSRVFAERVVRGLRAHGVDVLHRADLQGRLDQAAAAAATVIGSKLMSTVRARMPAASSTARQAGTMPG